MSALSSLLGTGGAVLGEAGRQMVQVQGADMDESNDPVICLLTPMARTHVIYGGFCAHAQKMSQPRCQERNNDDLVGDISRTLRQEANMNEWLMP